MDVHHHFIFTGGEYISPSDPRVHRVVESWRGTRPTFHYSISREDWLVGHNPDVVPDYKLLIESGQKKQKLRAHSNFMWNNAVNDWALGHLEWGDCMVEAKAKNLASFKLFEHWKSLKV